MSLKHSRSRSRQVDMRDSEKKSEVKICIRVKNNAQLFLQFVKLISQKQGRIRRRSYRKIPKISPGAYIFQRPFLRSLFLEGVIFGGKFAFQNRLD